MDCFVNGRILPEAQAKISPLDRGFMLGDGIFETIAIRDGRPEFLSQHLERMFQSAAALLIRMPVSPPRMVEILDDLIARNGINHGRARITLSRGVPEGECDDASPRPWTDAWQPTLLMVVRPANNSTIHSGVRLITASRQLAACSVARQHKSLSYLDLLHARHEARERGAFDALVLNTSGHVVECSIANIMWLDKSTRIVTPSLEAGCLPGIMRRVAIDAARAEGLSVIEGLSPPGDLQRARSAWVLNSTLRLGRVTQLDGIDLGFDATVHERLQQAIEKQAAESRAAHARLDWWQ